MSTSPRVWTDFDEFFRTEFLCVVGFVVKAGVGRDEARDAAQEAMADAFRLWSGLTNPSAWVRRAAYGHAMRHYSRDQEGYRRALAGGWAAPQTVTDPWAAIHEGPAVAVLLAKLPVRQRMVMAWHLDGFDVAEIAEQLHIRPATVRSTLRHARTRLQKLLDNPAQQLEGGENGGR
ncbi:RNA polymerase sigma factor [Kutzneria albida]|uniref:RNA polymerase sigma factor 70 region 4 type 2 domain-containing protein n=1 Tax=Kutzneria albida DSM 43870 TaxID=1449976 RepID=W5WDD3_9PSEU|nr:sigma-70 family RNA polymerase sigma factor [Kutzneria albida]AHH98591.1 hypothetical protein KALB_5229 [Kutzneria albida DSM 43870]